MHDAYGLFIIVNKNNNQYIPTLVRDKDIKMHWGAVGQNVEVPGRKKKGAAPVSPRLANHRAHFSPGALLKVVPAFNLPA